MKAFKKEIVNKNETGVKHMPNMDSQNAERLVNAYADMILRLSCMYLKKTHDAEDICQDVLLKLLLGNFNFENPEHEKAYIIRTTINACKDHLRTAFWKYAVDLESAPDIAVPERPDSKIFELVMELPKNYRTSIYLHYYEGYRVNEIAAMLGKSENAVSAYLTRGRKRLKCLLGRIDTKGKSNLKGVAHNAQRF